MLMRRFPAILCFAALAAASACGGIDSPSSNQVETLTGTVAVGDAISHPFSVGKTGELFATITQLSPDTNVLIGMSVGQATSSGCAPLIGFINNTAHLNAQALGGVIQKGSYCLQVFDAGFLTQPANYTVRLSHP